VLELRPTCENCNIELPADSTQAMICTYECTFCAGCVDKVLGNVCPNCGGGFVPRPIRPKNEWRKGLSTSHQKPSKELKHKPVDCAEHAVFAASIKNIPPARR